MKKKIKRLMSSPMTRMILVIGLCLSMLAGCGGPAGNDSSENGEKITPFATDADQGNHGGSGDDGTGGNGSGGDGEDNTLQLNKDVIYRSTELGLELPMSRDLRIASGGGMVYVSGNNVYSDSSLNSWMEYMIVSCDPDSGEVTTVYPYLEGTTGADEGGNGEKVSAMAATPEGDLVMLIRQQRSYSDKHYQLVKVDSAGKVKWITDIGKVKMDYPAVACSDDRVYTTGDGDLLVYDLETGVSMKSVDCSACGMIFEIFASADGAVYVTYFRSPDSIPHWKLAAVDVENGSVSEALTLPWEGFFEGFTDGGAFSDFLRYTENYVWSWNAEEESFNEKINLLDSGIDGSMIINLTAVREDAYWVIWRETMNGHISESVRTLTRVPPEDIPEKTLITIGCFSASDIEERIREFNGESGEYRVKLIDYSVYGDENGLTQLNLDITSGNAPDIFLVNGRIKQQMDAYIRQGVLEDLNTWIDGDPEIDRADYLNNIFEAYEVDGGLYELPSSFTIDTVSGDADLVGDAPGWTLEEMRQVEAKHPEYRLFPRHITRESFLNDIMRFGTAVDEVNGTCSFDSPEFIELLELVKEFPTATDNSDTRSSILTMSFIRSFEDFRRQEIQYNPGRAGITYIGYPGMEGNGALIQDGKLSFAMSAESDHKEGAWEFMRYYLGEEYQQEISDNNVSEQFPVLLSALGDQAKRATSARDEDGKDEDGTVTVQGISEARVAELMDYLKSLDQTGRLNYEIYNIVAEEAEAFFLGQKTAADVARIIQSKISIYLAEQQ